MSINTENDRISLNKFLEVIENGNEYCNINDQLFIQFEKMNNELKEKDCSIRLLQRHLQLDIEGVVLKLNFHFLFYVCKFRFNTRE